MRAVRQPATRRNLLDSAGTTGLQRVDQWSRVPANFDILATAGAANKALVRQFTATADGTGKLTIQFATVKGNAQVNGVEILSAGATGSPTPPPPSSVQIDSASGS
jgi:hypothetical protein